MTDVLSGNPVARALGVALLQFVWQGAVIACVTALALQVLRRHSPNARYVVACFGLVTMLAAPIITASTSASKVSVDAANPDTASGARHAALPAGAPAGDVAVPDPLFSASLSRFLSPDLVERQLPVIVTMWAFGVLLLILQLAGSWLLVERIRRISTRPLARISEAYLRELATRMHVTRKLRIAVSARVNVPTVIGWIRPLILIPSSAMAGLSPFQLQAIIAHEIAHIRRHDYVINVLQSLVETLLFYHPGVWWMSKQIRLEREHCCDDAAAEACGDRVAYARALASLEELRADAPILALAATGGDLVTRIRRLLGRPQPAPPQPTWMVISLAVATVSLVFAGGRVGRAATTAAPSASDIATIASPGPRANNIVAPLVPATAEPAAPKHSQAAAVTPQQSASTRTTPDQLQVTQAEGQLHVAKMRNDAATVAQLLADEFVGTDQNGNTRNKTGTLNLIRTVGINSISQAISEVRVTNGMAVVTGSAIEASTAGTDRMIFTRVWRKDDAGWWKLLSNSQFRDPRIARPQTAASQTGVQPDVASTPRDPQGPVVTTLSGPPAGTPLRVGGDIKEPKKIKDVKPVYPQIAFAAGVQGIVIMEVVIDEQGGVASARVLRSQPLLDQAAMDAVKQWQFTPTLLNGAPVQVIMTVTVNFTLQ